MAADIAKIIVMATIYFQVNGCMVGNDVEKTFVIDNICYWSISPLGFTSWESAKKVCEDESGVMATIPSNQTNFQIAAQLNR